MKNSSELHLTCEAVQEELLERFDQGSFDRLTEPAAEHLSICAACKNDLKKLIALTKNLEKLPVSIPEEPYWVGYLPRLRERIDVGRTSSLVRRPVWAPSLTVAALFSLFVAFSPVKIAPPTWFQTDKMVIATDQVLHEDELSKLEKIFSGEETVDLDLEQLELKLIYELSRIRYENPKDLYDQLAEVDDLTLEEILKQLNAKPII